MTFDTTRRHKTECQEVDSHRNLNILTKSWRISPISAQNQNLGWTQLESTSKIIMVEFENASFAYDLTFEIWSSEGSGPLTGGPSDSQIMSLGGKCFTQQ